MNQQASTDSAAAILPSDHRFPPDRAHEIDAVYCVRGTTKPEVAADTWIDESQWQAGFPPNWGECRSLRWLSF
jgi:hypothetical protein